MSALNDPYDAYLRTRGRVCELLAGAGPQDLDRVVPACPEWRVRDLAAHLVSMPAALGSGRYPTGDIGVWLQEMVAERDGSDVSAQLDEWCSLDEALAALLTGGGGLLFDDLAVHEHDLRGALERPDHAALDVDIVLPRALGALSAKVTEAGLGPIEVRFAESCWRSGGAADAADGEPGWILLAHPWEAHRAISSRRTAVEIMALPAQGSAEPYLAVLDAHLALPDASLGES